MRRAPLVPFAVATLSGIVLQHHAVGLPTPAMWLASATAALLVGLLLVWRRRPMVPLLLFALAAGALAGRLADPRYDAMQWSSDCPEKAFFEVRLTETPMPKGKTFRAKARVATCNGRAVRGTMRLYLKQDSCGAALRYGDRLLLHGYPDTSWGSIYLTGDHYLVTGRDSTSLRSRCERLRMRLLSRMQSGGVDPRYLGVAEAMTLGWRADIDSVMQDNYRDAGIAHLLCVSGLHVGLLAAIVGACLFWVGGTRRGRMVKGAVQLLAVWAFTALTGLAPSTVRAALMFSLLIVARVAGRRTSSLNILAATALVTLLADPMLAFDVGWMLSYASVAGILMALPLTGLLRSRLWASAVVSVSATLATLPITLSVFHRFSLYFLIANVLVVPAAGLVLGLSLLYIAFPQWGALGGVLEWLLRMVDGLTAWVSSLPHGVVADVAPSPLALALLSAGIIMLLVAIKPAMWRYKKTWSSKNT